ncbi:MAG: HAD hydrolase family protein, partial [Candidatus Methanomethylicia archaeon]|nr:HAD hydrolase family protein [Candidatus Methanomethylicia archaeon]
RGLLAVKGLIGSKRVCAIGDDLNDISLFEAADIKVAVKNAVSRIMEEADIVCENDDGKGVLEIIRAIEWW